MSKTVFLDSLFFFLVFNENLFGGVFVQAEKRLTVQVCNQFKNAVEESDGNEVFAVGNINDEGIVFSIKICARGNAHAVPVTNEKNNCSVIIHNHPSGFLQPSDADLQIATRAAENGQGFYIVNNDVTKIYVVVEPIKPRKLKKIDIQLIKNLLSAGGALDAISSHFEERIGQIHLASDIACSFNQNKVGIFEAGTGVGKSFAYLLPSMLWAINNKERIVISTGTINLQQQLIEKDIPLAEKIVGKKIKAVLMKGRQNYICKRRLQDACSDRDLFEDDAEQFDSIIVWSEKTETGSRSDLSFFPLESIWSRVNSESDACMGLRCPFHENCFVMKVRKEAADANILVVNHHLLFADLETRIMGAGFDDTAVLPPYKRIVFDEAHGIEHAATSFFSEQLNRFKISKQINILYRHRRGATAGHLFTLEALSSRSDKVTDVVNSINSIKEHLLELEEEALLLFPYEYSWRLCEETAMSATKMLNKMDLLKEDIVALANSFRLIIDGIGEKDLDSPCVWETKQIIYRLEGAAGVCRSFVEWSERKDTIFWIDKVRFNGKKGSVIYPRFYATPLDIAPKMQKGVFESLDTVICTSATIKTGNSFSYWMYRTGAAFTEEERLLCQEYASPFPYDKNLLLAVPSDIPLPDNRSFQSEIEKAIVRLIRVAGGKTLVLFTSYESLTSACDYCRNVFKNEGITVLRQGDDDRFRLLEQFKNDVSSVLFATDSFWEGVDVPGDSLSQVIIVKLPFSVPSDPIFAARSEAITQKGGNAFMDLSLPEAIIKFRQGFGRLIRRASDKGAVVVLDRRIVEKRYGSLFIQSVPKCRFITETLSEIEQKIEKMLF